jgi:hypothetical protein
MTTEHKMIGGVVLLTLSLIVGWAWLSDSKATEEKERLGQPPLGEAVADDGASHVPVGTEVAYKSNPPVGGPHYALTQRAGIYNEAIPDGKLVHSLEHGAVILWYKSDLAQEAIEKLKEIYRSTAISKKIMVPRESLDVPVALTSWGRILKLETIDEEKIKEFMLVNHDRAPEKAPL